MLLRYNDKVNSFIFDLQRFTKITADPISIDLRRGETGSIAFTGIPSHGGDLSYVIVNGDPNFVTLNNDNTVTFFASSDLSSGSYWFIIRVIETYIEVGYGSMWTEWTNTDSLKSKMGGGVLELHSEQIPNKRYEGTKTDTADVQITVNILVPIIPN